MGGTQNKNPFADYSIPCHVHIFKTAIVDLVRKSTYYAVRFFCALRTASCVLPIAHCLLPTAYYLHGLSPTPLTKDRDMILKIPRRPEDSPLTRFLRIMALIGVFVLVGVLYWKYYEHSLDRILTKQAIWDQTKTLTSEQKKSIQAFGRMLKSRYGMDFKLKITTDSVFIPKVNSRTLFVGLCPAKHEVKFIFPPLLRSALGIRFEEYLTHEHFETYWPDNLWTQGLGSALTLIANKLEHLDRNDQTM